MHAILFQMALLPITMCRYSIAALSESFIDKIVPLNRTLKMHIHLGYTLIIIVCLATAFFFAFFGLLCADGDQQFCDKFTSEIMITGYAILVSLLIIGGTSFFRHKIPYELFYGIHHLVFIMYFITIAHTIDVQERTGNKQRSQTFRWFSSTLAFYFCDRAAMYLNHWYETRLLGASVVTSSSGSKMVLLKLSRPALFRFKPGQYAFLRVNSIDNQWHPFSIASYPDSSQLEFYIEVYDGKAWTMKLCDLLEANNGRGGASSFRLNVEVMGPYGTPLAKTEDYSHILAVGAGTGTSKMISEEKPVREIQI
jgi:predicted ferric reductase